MAQLGLLSAIYVFCCTFILTTEPSVAIFSLSVDFLGECDALIGDCVDTVTSTDSGVTAQHGLLLDRKGNPCWFSHLPPQGSSAALASGVQASKPTSMLIRRGRYSYAQSEE